MNFGKRVTSAEVGERGGGSTVCGKFSGWRSVLIEVLGAFTSRACLSDRKMLGWWMVS